MPSLEYKRAEQAPNTRAWLLAGATLLLIGVGPSIASARADKGASAPTVSMPKSFADTSAAGGLPVEALDRWWTLFSDPILDRLEDEALRSASDAQTAAARLLEAQSVRRAQVLKTLPAGAAKGTAGRERASDLGQNNTPLNPIGGVTDSLSGQLNFSWELDLFGRLNAARRVAAADAAQARFNVEGVRASLAAAVADAYFQTQGLAVQTADARRTVEIRSDLLTIAQRKVKAGMVGPDQVDLAEGVLAQAQAQLDLIAARYAAAQRDLLILAGRDLADTAALETTAQPLELPVTPTALPSDLLRRRPDVREAEYRLNSALGAATLAHRAVFPSITLLPVLGISRTVSPGVSFIPPATIIQNKQTTDLGFWNLAVGVSAPTLDIPRLLAEAKAQDARARQAAVAYEKTVRTAFGEAQDAFTLLAADRKATLGLTAGEQRAQAAFEASRRRYAEGLDDLSATLQAEQSWRALRSDLTGDRTAALRRVVSVFKALGGGWNSAATASNSAAGAGQ